MSSVPIELTLTEADLQAAVLQLAKHYKWKTAHFHDSRRQVRPGVFVGDVDAKGFPDIFAVRIDPRRGTARALAIELKSEKGRVSKEQDEWLLALEQVEGVEQYCLRPSDWFSGAIEEILR